MQRRTLYRSLSGTRGNCGMGWDGGGVRCGLWDQLPHLRSADSCCVYGPARQPRPACLGCGSMLGANGEMMTRLAHHEITSPGLILSLPLL